MAYSSTVSNMIFVLQNLKKMYDCCSIVAPKHQEMALLIQNGLFGKI